MLLTDDAWPLEGPSGNKTFWIYLPFVNILIQNKKTWEWLVWVHEYFLVYDSI